MKAALSYAILAGLCNGAFSSLEVVTPAEGDIVIADRTYTIEWTGSSGGRFDIDLYLCDTSYCTEDSCGEFVSSLCPYADKGCPDSDGDYDVVLPEPVGGSGGGYTILMSDIHDNSNYDCSREFYLMASGDAPRVGGVDGPSMEVVFPTADDTIFPGETFTVQFVYDNGVGQTADRFDIDLYIEVGEEDACGTKVESLCDKPEIGCKDSEGNYDVTIPPAAEAGTYKIKVARHETGEPQDCSPSFEIIGGGQSSKHVTLAPDPAPGPSNLGPTPVPFMPEPTDTPEPVPATPAPTEVVPAPSMPEPTDTPEPIPATPEPSEAIPAPPMPEPTDTPEPVPATPEPANATRAPSTREPTGTPERAPVPSTPGPALDSPNPVATEGFCSGTMAECPTWACLGCEFGCQDVQASCGTLGVRCNLAGCVVDNSGITLDLPLFPTGAPPPLSGEGTCEGSSLPCSNFNTVDDCETLGCIWS